MVLLTGRRNEGDRKIYSDKGCGAGATSFAQKERKKRSKS